MDGFVIFTTQEWGFNRDEVSKHIMQLHQEYEEMYVKYQTLKESYKRLNEEVKVLSGKSD